MRRSASWLVHAPRNAGKHRSDRGPFVLSALTDKA
jgi:hypothetical protein